MTIRDYIKRRVRWGFTIAFLSLFFLVLTSHMGFAGPGPNYLTFFGAFVLFGAILSLQYIRCPKCRARIGQNIAVPATFPLSGPVVKCCPYCGVSLNEHMS
jgi:hypothetical protein